MSYSNLWFDQKDAIFLLSSETMFSGAYTGIGKYPCYSLLLDYLRRGVCQLQAFIITITYFKPNVCCDDMYLLSACVMTYFYSNEPWAPCKDTALLIRPLCNWTGGNHDQLSLSLSLHVICECIQSETVLNGVDSLAIWYVHCCWSPVAVCKVQAALVLTMLSVIRATQAR